MIYLQQLLRHPGSKISRTHIDANRIDIPRLENTTIVTGYFSSLANNHVKLEFLVCAFVQRWCLTSRMGDGVDCKLAYGHEPAQARMPSQMPMEGGA